MDSAKHVTLVISLFAMLTASAFAGEPRFVEITAHRGAGTLVPENTLLAIETGAKNGAQYVELDVRTAGDGTLVLMHDDNVERTTDGTGRISELTIDEIRALDAGSWKGEQYAGLRVPTFAEAIEKCRELDIGIYLDLKDGTPEAISGILKEHDFVRSTILNASPMLFREYHRLIPEIRCLAAGMGVVSDAMLPILRRQGCDVLGGDNRGWNAENVARAKELGFEIVVNSLGDKDNAEGIEEIASWGVDGIQTDRPDIASEVLTRLGLRERPQTRELKYIEVAGHRGAGTLVPENTIIAITTGKLHGVEYCELDVRTTSDEELVLMHDQAVDRTTDGSGAVRSLTLEQIRALDAGSWKGDAYVGTRVPTFEDAVRHCSEIGVGIYLDHKDADVAKCAEILKKYDWVEHTIVYSSPTSFQSFRRLAPGIRTMTAGFEAVGTPMMRMLESMGTDYLDGSADGWNADKVRSAHEAGFKVFLDIQGGHDNPRDIEEIAGWGVDGVQTDRPDVTVQVLKRLGYRGEISDDDTDFWMLEPRSRLCYTNLSYICAIK
ncbi:MAG: hypothetical protein NUW37_14175 [Planctomycetes bacterium]|nr:hypothetical protein [Planctomycetota bacterium]